MRQSSTRGCICHCLWFRTVGACRRGILTGKSVALLVLATSVVGCVAGPQAATLGPPQPAKAKSAQDALIERVVVADPRLSAPDVVEESLTINLADLVSRAGYFREVRVVPEKITQGYHLILRFERYNVTRHVHPALYPAAFATLTLYIWFGGPIFRDEIDLKADLKIAAADGRTLATKSEELEYSENVGLYSPNRSFSDGREERTKLIQSLIDAALAQLQTSGGRS